MSGKNVPRRPAVTPPPARLPRETHAGRSLRGQPRLPANPPPHANAPFLLRSNARFKSLGIRDNDSST